MTDSTLHYTRVPIANEQNTMMGLMHRGGDNASACVVSTGHWIGMQSELKEKRRTTTGSYS